MAEIGLVALLCLFFPLVRRADKKRWRRVESAIGLVEDTSLTVARVRQERELDIADEALLVPCAWMQDAPRNTPEQMARVMVVQAEALLLVDPFGDDDFFVSLANVKYDVGPKYSYVRGRHGSATSRTDWPSTSQIRLVAPSDRLVLAKNPTRLSVLRTAIYRRAKGLGV